MTEKQAADLQLAMDTFGYVIVGSMDEFKVGDIIPNFAMEGNVEHPLRVIAQTTIEEFNLEQKLFGAPVMDVSRYKYHYRCITD